MTRMHNRRKRRPEGQGGDSHFHLHTFIIFTLIILGSLLLQVRMQSEGKLAAGVAKKYPSAFAAYSIIAREEGVMGLWKGLGPNIARNAIINAAELASYDQVSGDPLFEPYSQSWYMDPGVAWFDEASRLCADAQVMRPDPGSPAS